ncbi:mannose-6-phosphate isomerase-like protein (cupin superfamily) [Rhodococcus sp. 27YEA15]|uniref:cupin domain-containing protein n=1 Tax=Rhodococcus sp. 27YEA15 TaxID=3156259 RepID=UPI003C7B1CCD
MTRSTSTASKIAARNVVGIARASGRLLTVGTLAVILAGCAGDSDDKSDSTDTKPVSQVSVSDPRLVITGHDDQKRGLVVSDQRIAPNPNLTADGWQSAMLWGADGPGHFPDDGTGSVTSPPMPAPGGVRLAELVVYPTGQGPAGASDNSPDAITKSDPNSPIHHTPSADLVVVLEGEVELQLDSGNVVLKQGDYLVQNGTAHAWHNRTDSPARLGVVVLGAAHDGY